MVSKDTPVSYTHLDVYKRQGYGSACVLMQKSILEDLRLFIAHKTYEIVYAIYLTIIIIIVFANLVF